MQDNSNEYFKNTIDRLNDTRSNDFWNSINKLKRDETDSGVAPLFKNDKFHFESKDKASILRETFFTGKHLEGIAFNEDHKVLVENHLPELLQAKTVDTREILFNSDFTLEELEHTFTLPTDHWVKDIAPGSFLKLFFLRKQGKPDYTNPSA